MKFLNIAIGFVTGRANVCNIINTYYNFVKEQVKSYYKNTNVTFYILYDLEYQNTKKEEFYKLDPKVFETDNIKVKYITPEYIAELKIKMMEKYKLTQENVDSIIGNGHARGRNTIMYSSYCDNMDYLYFWDDDEYPIACIRNEDGTIDWKMQENILKHIEAMEKYNADVTIGYHCGYISPIPYMNLEKKENEKALNDFIKAISNEIVTWEEIKEKYEKSNGVTFAKENILSSEPYEILGENGKKFVAGSTLCINLKHIDKVPAFYNPKGARGEDTFFSINLNEAKVMRVPVYHFHDGFLKYKQIMSKKYPEELRLIRHSEEAVEKRFFNACLGWIKYKPLLIYILEKEDYRIIMNDVYERLKSSIPKINKLYPNCDFNQLLEALKQYDENVEMDYKSFAEVNNIWNELKMKFYNK